MHLRAKHVHVEAQLLANGLDVLETLLVVGTSTADPDLDLVLVQDGGNFAESTDNTLECGCNVGEIGNTTTNEENLALGAHGSAEHQVEHSARVVEGLGLGWSTRVFTVVGELADVSSGSDGISVDDGGTATSNESPDAASRVQDGKLEGSAGLGVHVGNVLLLFGQLTAKGSGELHWGTSVDVDLAILLQRRRNAQGSRRASNGPFGAALKLSSLVEFGGQVEEVDISGGSVSVGDDDEGVDFEVCELAVDVDGVETGDEVHQDVMDALWDVLEQRRRDLLV